MEEENREEGAVRILKKAGIENKRKTNIKKNGRSKSPSPGPRIGCSLTCFRCDSMSHLVDDCRVYVWSSSTCRIYGLQHRTSNCKNKKYEDLSRAKACLLTSVMTNDYNDNKTWSSVSNST